MDVTDKLLAEFFIRRQRNPRVSPANLISGLKLRDCYDISKLKKASVLRDISMRLARGEIDEKMLDLLETLELLLLEENSVLLDSHKLAYCWIAVACTFNYMWPVPELDSLFPDALEKIWTKRIGVLKEHKSKLVTSELLKWETELRKALEEPELYQRIIQTNIRYTAVTYLTQVIKEQWALYGCSSLESVAQKWFTKQKAESVRSPNAARNLDNLGGSDAVDENIDKSEQEQEQEHESSVSNGNKLVAQELKDCLLEVQGMIDSSAGKGPNNANDHVLNVNPQPTLGGGQDHTPQPRPGGGGQDHTSQPRPGGGQDHTPQPTPGGGQDHTPQPRPEGSRDHTPQPRPGGSRDHTPQSRPEEGQDHTPQPRPEGGKDHTPQPRPGGGQDHNKSPIRDNVNERGLDDSQGTSSGRVRPYLPTPVPLRVSPLKKGRVTKPHVRRPRKLWKPEEVEALTQGVREYGKAWNSIKNANPLAFADRTEVDLKDKWRNLIR